MGISLGGIWLALGGVEGWRMEHPKGMGAGGVSPCPTQHAPAGVTAGFVKNPLRCMGGGTESTAL